jgi:hypothetical protein
MKKFASFSGTIIGIEDFWVDETGQNSGCYKLFSLVDDYGNPANFVIERTTYFVNHITAGLGDRVTGFYDANAPVPLIYPPQYRALVMSKAMPNRNVKVDYFNNELVGSDNNLKLNLSPYTQILLENDQAFTKSPANRNLIVIYGPSTKSIPAQTTPYKIIVMCL